MTEVDRLHVFHIDVHELSAQYVYGVSHPKFLMLSICSLFDLKYTLPNHHSNSQDISILFCIRELIMRSYMLEHLLEQKCNLLSFCLIDLPKFLGHLMCIFVKQYLHAINLLSSGSILFDFLSSSSKTDTKKDKNKQKQSGMCIHNTCNIKYKNQKECNIYDQNTNASISCKYQRSKLQKQYL